MCERSAGHICRDKGRFSGLKFWSRGGDVGESNVRIWKLSSSEDYLTVLNISRCILPMWLSVVADNGVGRHSNLEPGEPQRDQNINVPEDNFCFIEPSIVITIFISHPKPSPDSHRVIARKSPPSLHKIGLPYPRSGHAYHAHAYLLLGRHHRLHIPNHLRILINTPITTKEAHPAHTSNALRQPLLLIPKRLINQILRLAVAVEVIRDEVVIAMVDDSIRECREGARITKHTALDGVEDLFEFFVELVVAVDVGVAELVDIFGEVAEEEDVVFADFAGDFDLSVVSIFAFVIERTMRDSH